MSSRDDFLKEADFAIAQANASDDPAHRREWLKIAQAWLTFAESGSSTVSGQSVRPGKAA
jgi:hypothetical protein